MTAAEVFAWIPTLIIIALVFVAAWFDLSRRAGDDTDNWRSGDR